MRKRLNLAKYLLPLALVAAVLSLTRHVDHVSAQSPVRFKGPTSSQPLALSADDSLLMVANPDNNTVTLFDVKNGNARLAEIHPQHLCPVVDEGVGDRAPDPLRRAGDDDGTSGEPRGTHGTSG